MGQTKNRLEARLQELILRARSLNVQVRKEKLLREAGYRVHSGRCRINGQDVIYLDRDIPLDEQIEFLASELAELQAPAVVELDRAQTPNPE